MTAGNDSETGQLRAARQAYRLQVVDRGDADYEPFQDVLDAQSDFSGRLRDNAVWRVVEERPPTAEARAAGVRGDRGVWLGGPHGGASGKQFAPVNVVSCALHTDAVGSRTGLYRAAGESKTRRPRRAFAAHPPRLGRRYPQDQHPRVVILIDKAPGAPASRSGRRWPTVRSRS